MKWYDVFFYRLFLWPPAIAMYALTRPICSSSSSSSSLAWELMGEVLVVSVCVVPQIKSIPSPSSSGLNLQSRSPPPPLPLTSVTVHEEVVSTPAAIRSHACSTTNVSATSASAASVSQPPVSGVCLTGKDGIVTPTGNTTVCQGGRGKDRCGHTATVHCAQCGVLCPSCEVCRRSAWS